jgi:hypothetical protein
VRQIVPHHFHPIQRKLALHRRLAERGIPASFGLPMAENGL